jgi:hypothetical protein
MDSETFVRRIRVFTAGSPLYGRRYRLPADRVWSWTPLSAQDGPTGSIVIA